MLVPVSNFFAPFPFTVDYSPVAEGSNGPSLLPPAQPLQSNLNDLGTDTVNIQSPQQN